MFKLPTEIPKKYENRIKFFFEVENINFYCIHSQQHAQPFVVSINNIRKNEGEWLCSGDCIPRGKFMPTNQEEKCTYFGVEIDKTQAQAILKLDDILCKSENVDAYTVVYHGSNISNLQGILEEGIKETYGMVGQGCYLGTYWKASRFACWGQEYKMQQGCIFRCFVTAKKVFSLPCDSWKCSCCKSIISDHTNTLIKENDCIFVDPPQYSVGLCRDGSPKYLLRNEEWCSKKEFVKIINYAFLDLTSYSSTYDPNYRNIKIK